MNEVDDESIFIVLNEQNKVYKQTKNITNELCREYINSNSK